MSYKLIKKRPYCRYSTGGKNYRIVFYNSKGNKPYGKRIKRFTYKGFDVTIIKVPIYGLPYEYELRPKNNNIKYLFERNHCDVIYDPTSHMFVNTNFGAVAAAKERINELLSPMYFWLMWLNFDKKES